MFPARYATGQPPPHSLLSRLLIRAPSQRARWDILKAVDWDTPEVYTSSPWSPFPGRLSMDLRKIHPLSAVAKAGNEALFSRALALAHERGTQDLVVESDSSKGLHLDDWVASRVLDTVAALGTPTMMRELIDKIQERMDRTSLLMVRHLRSTDVVIDPLGSLASSSARARDGEDYRLMLLEIERFYWMGLDHSGLREKGRAPDPWDNPAPGSLAWQVREQVRGHALIAAATHGNAPMLKAVLSLGHVPIDHTHVLRAMESGGLDLALDLMSRIPAAGEDDNFRPRLTPEDPAWQVWAQHLEGEMRPPQTEDTVLGADQLEELLSGLASSMGQWHATDPSEEWAEHKDAQMEIGDRVFQDLLERYAKTHPQSRTPEKLRRARFVPIWLRLSEQSAQQVACTLEGVAPSLRTWESLQGHPQAPWTRQMRIRVAGLDKDQTQAYLDTLGQDVVEAWKNLDEDAELEDLPAAAVLAQLWRDCKDNPHLPDLTRWVMDLGVVRGMPKQLQAHVHQQVMDAFLQGGPPTVPVPGRRPSKRF